MDELPFKRILRLKKANLECKALFSWEASSRGRLGDDGSRFAMRWMKPMVRKIGRSSGHDLLTALFDEPGDAQQSKIWRRHNGAARERRDETGV